MVFSATKTYDGQIYDSQITNDNTTWAGVSVMPVGINGTVTTTKATVGSYTTKDTDYKVELSTDESILKNFSISYSVVVNIVPAKLQVNPTSRTFTYNGAKHSLLDSEVTYSGAEAGSAGFVGNDYAVIQG